MKIVRIVYLFFIVISIMITPHMIDYATEIRGYKAYGGEYLIPLLGWTIATIFYEVCKEISEVKKLKRRR